MIENNNIYKYNAIVSGVYDGDTIDCLVDVGFKITTKIKVRLANINTPELRGDEREAGLIARDVLREKILHKKIIITTYKDKKGKYGRYIGEILIEEAILSEGVTTSTLVNVNNWLVENGYAVYKQY